MTKLAVAVTDSYTEVNNFSKHDKFAEIMLRLADDPTLELKDDIDFIVKSYIGAFKNVPIEETKELLVKGRKSLEGNNNKKKDKDKPKQVKSTLQKIFDCGLRKVEKKVSFDKFAGAIGSKEAKCIISKGVLADLMSSIGISGKTTCPRRICNYFNAYSIHIELAIAYSEQFEKGKSFSKCNFSTLIFHSPDGWWPM